MRQTMEEFARRGIGDFLEEALAAHYIRPGEELTLALADGRRIRGSFAALAKRAACGCAKRAAAKRNIFPEKLWMWLAVDCGNTRVKWALIKNGRAAAVRAAPLSSPATLAALKKAAAKADDIWAAQTGGGRRLQSALGGAGKVRFLRARARAAEWSTAIALRNHWESTAGWDWSAAERGRDWMIVSAGSALAADALRADGVFWGGIISPGVQRMRRAMRELGLKTAEDKDSIWPPLHTGAAVESGALLAAAGAAMLARKRLLPGAKFY